MTAWVLLGVVACFTTPPTPSVLLCIAQYVVGVATGTEAVDFVLSTLHGIVAERCAARCSFLAALKRWSNKRRALARRARIAKEKQARSGSLVSALVAARVGYMYGVRAAPGWSPRVALKVLLLLARKALNARDGLTKQALIRSGTKSLAYNYASPERVRVADVLASVGSEGYLLYGGKPLRAESTLAELNIYSGSTLLFIGWLLGGMDGVGGGCHGGTVNLYHQSY